MTQQKLFEGLTALMPVPGGFTLLDTIALVWFFGLLLAVDWYVEDGPKAHLSASAIMRGHRMEWMQIMARREMRMLDGNLLFGLQNGSSFFASTALVALGGSLAMIGQADRLAVIADALPVPHASGADTFRLRLFVPTGMLAYAFFKFAWAQRLFGYNAVLIGATPEWTQERDEEVLAAANRAGRLNGLAARSFARGLRGLYFALASLAWLLGPYAMMIAALSVALMIYRREFRSASRAAMLGES